MFKKNISLNYRILFICIIFLATFLRFWQLDAIPPGLHADEADTGYSAYSILKTGLGQYGTFNPLAVQESAGGTHPPLYTYTLLPLIHFFDLNLFIERVPSAIFGVLTVIVFFLLVKKLFQSNAIALIGALLLTLNPWAIQISRQGLLESISLFFICAGILFFIYANEKHKFWYLWSGIFFGLSLFAYDAPKIFLPPFLLILLLYKKETLLKTKKYALLFLGIIAIFYLLMLKVVIFDGQINDYTNVSVFKQEEIAKIVNTERTQTLAPLWMSNIFHNKATVSLDLVGGKFLQIFSLDWFFFNGHWNFQQAVGRMGQFYLFELPFFFLGIFFIFQKQKKLGFLLLSWLFLGALPGGLTTGNFPYRSVLLLPVPIIFSSVGIVWFWNYFKKKNLFFGFVVRTGLVCIGLIYITSYLFTYFYDYPVYASEAWAKQQNEVLRYAIAHQDQYAHIFIDGEHAWTNMYAFILKTDPATFQEAYQHPQTYKGVTVTHLEKCYFGNFTQVIAKLKKPEEYFPKNSLVIVDGEQFPKGKPLTSYKDPGGVRIIFNVFSIH